MSTPETTEVMYGAVDKTLKAFQELKYCMDGWWDHCAEPIRKALKELIKRGITIRYHIDIKKDNFQYCKMMAEDGHHLRHLPGVKNNFSIMDRLEYADTIITREERRFMQAIASNLKTFIEGSNPYLIPSGVMCYRLKKESDRLKKNPGYYKRYIRSL